MKFSMDSQMQFPLIELSLNQGETVFIQRGSMVYHTPNVRASIPNLMRVVLVWGVLSKL